MAFSSGAVSYAVPADDTSELGGYPVVPKDQLPKGLIDAGGSKLVYWTMAQPS